MLTSSLLGLMIGVILALTGAGGGILAVPLLVFVLHLSVAQAGPIGLMAVGMAAALGAVLGLKAGIVRYRAALLIAASGILLSPAGLLIAARVDSRWLGALFGVILLYVALRTVRQALSPARAPVAGRTPACLHERASGRLIWTRPCAGALTLWGAGAGLLSGMLGVGGGFVLIPALQRHTNLAMQPIVATSLAVIALVSLSGVAASAVSGTLDWTVALPFSGGALTGMLAGRALAGRLAGPQLQLGFGAVSAVAAVAMIVKAV